MKIIDNINTLWGDDLKQALQPGAKLKIAASCFSIYAYEALKKELENIESLEFIFTSPTFLPNEVADKIPKERKEFHIPKLERERNLYGNEFEIHLKNEVLYAIDKAVPSPIIFELTSKNKIKYSTAFKRPSEADKNKWVTSCYFESDWIHCETTKKKLPVVLDMGVLYESMLKNLIPQNTTKGESLAELVMRMETLRIKEKQFNRKVELNRELNVLKKDIKALKT